MVKQLYKNLVERLSILRSCPHAGKKQFESTKLLKSHLKIPDGWTCIKKRDK